MLKPDGSVLFTYVKDVLPAALCRFAFRTFSAAPIGRRFVRFCSVFYAREHMHLCGSLLRERERLAGLRGEL